MFEEKYNELSYSDQNAFGTTINRILLKGFIVRDIFDPREKIIKISPDYRYIERNYELINDYLNFSNWSIEIDKILGVVSLVNLSGENHIRLDRETSLILFVLRMIYENERKESNLTGESIYITTPVLIRTMLEHGILMPGKKLSGRGIAKSLRLLASHNIITKVSGNYDEGSVAFYILPSICYALDNEKIRAMSLALDKEMSESEETSDEIINED